MNNLHSILIVAVVATVTILLRFLPFFIFGGNKKTPAYIEYLSSVLPYAIMGMLVIYCLRKITPLNGNHALPELIASLFVVGIHLWKKNTLLSVGLGTVMYMFLVQVIF